MRTRVRSAAFIAAIVVALGMSVVTPTYADGTGVECPFNRCAVGATDPGNPGGAGDPGGDTSGGEGSPGPGGDEFPGDGNANANACQWRVMEPQPAADSSLWEGHSPSEGRVEFFLCDDGNLDPSGRNASQFRFAPTAPAGPTPQEVAATLAQRAMGELVMPSVQVQVGPNRDELAVQVPVWFWLDRSQVAVAPVTVSAGAVSVTAAAELTSITVSPGEWRSKTAGAAGGFVDAFECTGDAMYAAPAASVSWQQKPLCGYTYGYRSDKARTGGRGTWQATVTAHWHVTWTSTGAGGVGGDIDVPPATTAWPLQIGEWRAIGVPPHN